MSNKFKPSPWDNMVWVVTIVTVVIIPFFLWNTLSLVDIGIIDIAAIGIFIGCNGVFLFTPLSYTVSDEGISINRLIGNLAIERSKIKSVELAEKLGNGTRAFASGGVFGYIGVFDFYAIGRATLYCTRLKRVVVIKTVEKTYVISPNDPEEFCLAANNL